MRIRVGSFALFVGNATGIPEDSEINSAWADTIQTSTYVPYKPLVPGNERKFEQTLRHIRLLNTTTCRSQGLHYPPVRLTGRAPAYHPLLENIYFGRYYSTSE